MAACSEQHYQADNLNEQARVTPEQDKTQSFIQDPILLSPDKPSSSPSSEGIFSTDMGRRPWRPMRPSVVSIIREDPDEDAEEMACTYEQKYQNHCRHIGLHYTSVEAYWDGYDIQLLGREFLQQVLLAIDRHNTFKSQSLVDGYAAKWRKKNPDLWASLDLNWTMRQAFHEKFLNALVKYAEQELAMKVLDRLKEWKFPEGM